MSQDESFKLGVCDYPEQVPAGQYAAYPPMQRALGLSHVRIAEFAWSRLEPQRGQFAFGWLDDALDQLHAAGLEVVMSTPTAAPPAWLAAACPDILLVDEQGRRRTHGGRRHTDYSSERYWQEAARITEALARRYGAHPAVIGWQTDNEHGCHTTARSYSDAARRGFRRWLEARYGTVAALNDAWGAVFWSQEYAAFDEVELPNLVVYKPNPSQVLDFNRYSSERLIAFDRMQADILRAHSPGRFVTHNFMPFFADFDHYAAAAHLDFVSVDLYPLGILDFNASEADKLRYGGAGHPDLSGLMHDLHRGLKPRGAPGHWVMEQQCGQTDWATINPLPAGGAVRLWTLDAYAHGADRVTYFRWRAATAAQELFHSGLLHHDGSPDRGFAEVAALAPQLPALPLGAVQARVCLLHDYESCWLYDLQPHRQGMSYWQQLLLFYTALRELGVDVNVIPPGRELVGYALVVAPALLLLRPPHAELLREFASGGGQVVLGPRSATRDERGQVWADRQRHPLARLAGVRVANIAALRPGIELELSGGGAAHTWAESLEAQDPALESLERYRSGVLAGQMAATRLPIAAGAVQYLGTWSNDLIRRVLRSALSAGGVEVREQPPGVRRSARGNQVIVEDWLAVKAHLEPQ